MNKRLVARSFTIASFLSITTATLFNIFGQENLHASRPMNVIFILSDDHRYDFMSFLDTPPFLETPNLDRIREKGMHFRNAFVSTALCSPSRASILTGQYAHRHGVVDNQRPVPEGTVFFPQILQGIGYQTAFFGKWHMGDANDDPRPGFNHWESFRGQGDYYNPLLNINGERSQFEGYTADILTDHSLEWLQAQSGEQPFFLYLSHKSVHAMFEPETADLGRYDDEQLTYPVTMANTPQNYAGHPPWVEAQRYSWHGVDYMYHGNISFDEFFHRYTETLMGIDDSVGAVLDYLDASGLAEDTLVIYMGDNGFSFGEHGLIDKRHFYEESAKVPLLVRWPEKLAGGQPINQLVQNIDIAPTILEAAGLSAPAHMQGASLVPLLSRDETDWRDRIFYEYYWEMDFPQTPTMFGVRTERYKYIRYHGIWDTNEFYDLLNDPGETNNLIDAPEHQDLITGLATEVYQWLEETGGMQIPLKNVVRPKFGDHRNQSVL